MPAVSSNRWHLPELRWAAATSKWICGSQGTGSRADDGKQHIDAKALREFLEDPGGIGALRLRDFHIDCADGALALAEVSFSGELALESCEVRGDLDLTRSKFGALRIVKSSICGSIQASSASVAGWLILDGTTVSGAVLAPDVIVDGRVSFDGTEMGVGSFEKFEEVSLLLECATIDGRLSARGVKATAPVVLDGARMSGQLDLKDAHLQGSPLALSAKNVHVADIAHINGSKKKGPFRADGQVLITSSEFAGGLNCNRMCIESREQPDGALFDGRNVKIGGEFFLDRGTIVGDVLLTAADVRGQFNLSGLKICGQPKAAIDARGMRVGTDVWLDHLFDASSAVRLDRATIGGTLNAVAGRFAAHGTPEEAPTADEDPEASNKGIALSLASTSIGGDLVLGDESWTAKHKLSGFHAMGTVVLTDTHVAGRLKAAGGTFDGRGGDALRAEGIRVDTDMRFGSREDSKHKRRFEAHGPVRLSRATVTGSLDFTGARLKVRPRDGGHRLAASERALDASLARVGDRLVLRDLVVEGCVSLIGAQVGMLSDDKSYWDDPENNANTLELDDLRYGQLDRDWLDWRAGRAWLSRLHRYSAQPYLELARVERVMGRTRDARRLDIERHKARLSAPAAAERPKPPVSALNLLTRTADRWVGFLIGWGYARWRLATIWAILLVGAAFVFHWAGHHNIMRPSHPPLSLFGDAPESARCTPEYPCFESLTYSLDVILPVVELNQRDNWHPDSSTTRGKAIALVTIGLTLLGWAFATLLAASFTNVLKRE